MRLLPFIPPTFTDLQLQELSQASVLCESALAQMICLLQEIRHFRDATIPGISTNERRSLQVLALHLDFEVSSALYQQLLASHAIVQGAIDLDLLADQCFNLIQPSKR